MFKAFVLVRNLDSTADGLDFGEFTIKHVGLGFKEFREVLSSVDVNQDDWIFEKSYTQLPLGPPGSPVGGIPSDIEDILLLLRLYKPGDISFIRQVIIPPSGNTLVQFPYRAMNDLTATLLCDSRLSQRKAKHGKPSPVAFEKVRHGVLIGSQQQDGSFYAAERSNLIPNSTMWIEFWTTPRRSNQRSCLRRTTIHSV
jgi:hypothetical protein